MGRRVTASLVVLTDLLDLEQILTRELVDQRRLTYARRSKEGNRRTALQLSQQRVNTVAIERTHRIDVDTRSDGSHFLEGRGDVIALVRLRQDDNGDRSALPRKREEPLDAPQVQISVQAGEDEDLRLADGEHRVADPVALGDRPAPRIVLAEHAAGVGGALKLIGDPDQHGPVETGGVFRTIVAAQGDRLVQLVENNRQIDEGDRTFLVRSQGQFANLEEIRNLRTDINNFGGNGIVVERGLLRFVYDRDETFQLLLTFALVLMLEDLIRMTWGTAPVSTGETNSSAP